MNRTLPLICACLLAALVLGCGKKEDAAKPAGDLGTGPVRVATSISVFADMVRRVGGDRVTVITLIPPGADAHTFQPAPKDVKKLTDVRAVFVNGTHLEESLEGILTNNVPRTAQVVELSAGLTPIDFDQEPVGPEEKKGTGKGADEHEEGGNPHFWLDIQNAKLYVTKMRDTLIAIDTEAAVTYRANADRYLKELDETDTYIRAQIATIPADQRKLVTFHDAFPYFARAYGLELVGYVVRAPGREPSAQEIKELGQILGRQKVKTVFKEPQLNAKLLEQAAKDAGVAVAVLYSDALTSDITSYVAMMRRNADNVTQGLK